MYLSQLTSIFEGRVGALQNKAQIPIKTAGAPFGFWEK